MTLPELSRSGPIAYREVGEGPALLLMHGIGGSSKTWEEQYRAFAGSRRVIGWDAPGFGGSDPAPEQTADCWADEAAGLLDRLGIGTAVLLGHSMGGIIAPRVASRHAGRIDRIVLSGTRAGFVGALGFEERQREFDTLTPEERGRTRAATMAAPGARPEVLARLATIAGEVTREAFAGGVAVLNGTDNRDILKALDIPALVLCGNQDGIAPPERGEEIAALLADVRMTCFAGAGHAAYAEKPEEYNAQLAKFLAE